MPPPVNPGGVANRLGPYESWMFDIGKVFDLPDLMLADSAHLSAVAEFATPVTLNGFALPPGAAQGHHRIRLPALYRDPGFKASFLPFMISPAQPSGPRLLDQNAAAVQGFAASLGPVTQGQIRLNFPIRDETVDPTLLATPTPPPIDPALAGQAPKVILAIIDLGIPFAHGNFRHPGTAATRIDYCWSQSAPAVPTGTVLFGREFRRDQIDALVATHNGDEDAVYRASGLLSRPDGPPMPLSRAASHGAHCLDLMAGTWPAASAAQARIIAVDLPSSPVWETSGFGKDMFVVAALHYIFNRADLIAQSHGCADLPMVINLSYGHSGGPHDGSSLIEAALAELVAHRNAKAPTTLLMPSGNMFQNRLFAHLTDQHFTPDSADPGAKTARLQWFAPPNDRTSSFLEFWYPPGTTPQDINIAVTPPLSGQATGTVGMALDPSGFAVRKIVVGGKIVGHLTLDHHRGTRWRVMVLLAPSETFAPPGKLVAGPDTYGTAPAGLWTLTFRLPAAMALPEATASAGIGGIQARIQRDISYGQGNTGARQSYFVDPLDQPFADDGSLAALDPVADGAKLRRFGSLNGMATGGETLVVGGYVRASGKAAIYASAGLPSASGGLIGKGTDISAPTERAALFPGMVAAGTRSGATIGASGTSSASPQVARLLALSQIASPLPIGASHAAVLSRLASLPEVTPVTETGTGPTGQLRLGGLLAWTSGPTEQNGS